MLRLPERVDVYTVGRFSGDGEPRVGCSSIGITVRSCVVVALSCCIGIETTHAQVDFTDDAMRTIALPAAVERVFAAGAPAEVLLYTLVPEKLAGRNNVPAPAALEFLPAEYRNPRQIVNLPERDDPRYDAELLALDVDVYVDYGTVDADYVAALDAISRRTRVPAIILDGSLENVPSVYRRLGAAFGVPQRGERLAAEASRLIERYRGALAEPPVKVYLACSPNGLTPCVEGHSSGEAAALLGATNVGGKVGDQRGPLAPAQIRERAPDVVIAASRAAAQALRASPDWRSLPAVAAGRVYAAPDLPFNWGARPPSVNRLLGVIWLAYVARGRPFDAEFRAEVSRVFAVFYHVTLTEAQLDRLLAD
jgi:iron complex transport system substrate-binding protein